MTQKWAILGGGLTGVTLARLLHEKGDDVVVFEKNAKTGGLCISEKRNGFTFDVGGSHIIFSRDTEVLTFMQNVLEENREFRNRNTKIFYKGKYVKYPFENGLSALPKDDLFFCINEYVKNLVAVEKGEVPEPQNFKDWIYYTFGKGIAECYLVPYNEKIWNYPTDKMSKHWMDGRVPRPPVEDIIKSAVGIETEGYTHQAVFTYPIEGGIEALVRAIEAPVKEFIKTNTEVTKVERNGNGWKITAGGEVFEADRVVSTLPLQVLIPMLSEIPDEVKKAVANLHYNSIACISVGIKGEVPDLPITNTMLHECLTNTIKHGNGSKMVVESILDEKHYTLTCRNNGKTMDIIIENNYEGKLIREVLQKELGFSSNLIKKLKFSPDGIHVNGQWVTVRYTLKKGDVLSLAVEDKPEDVSPYIIPAQLELPIIYEDEYVTAVNKPYNMPSHPSQGHRLDTVANALAYHFQPKTYVFRPVNRLDRDTSGCMLTANTKDASYKMYSAMVDGKIKKTYVAVLDGVPDEREGRLVSYMHRQAESIIVREECPPDAPDAKIAVTDYRVVSENGEKCVVLASPVTGRTHQIRAHLSSIGHPLLGDGKYGKLDKRFDRTYQALYSYQLTFCFTTEAGCLESLNGRRFQVEQVDFVDTYFPGFKVK